MGDSKGFMFSEYSQLKAMEQQASDPFDRLPDEVYQLIFLAVSDCKSLVRCMAVSKAFREHSERVSTLSIVCPGQFTSYVDKLQRIYTMVRRFYCLEVLIVRVGQPKDEPPSWARCMRYAEIGLSVEKFVFMAAKTGEFSEFDSALRGDPVMRNERTSDGEAEGTAGEDDSAESARNQVGGDDGSSTGFLQETSRLSLDKASSSEGVSSFKDRVIPDFNLRQVVAPSNDVLKRMVPVIVFAIVQGLDELRDSVPAFISKFESLRTFLLVDMLESVTVFMREHQIQQIRSHLQQGGGPIQEDAAASESEATANEEDEVAAIEDREVMDADDERTEMSKHDGEAVPPACFRSLSINDGRRDADACFSDKKGKALEAGDELNSNRKQKGKEVEPMAESSSGPSGCSEEQQPVQGFQGVKSDEVDEDEVTSPLRHGDAEGSSQNPEEAHPARVSSAGGCSSSADDHQAVAWGGGESVASYHPGFPLSGSEDDGRLDRGDERASSDDGAETWRNCRGICIHGPGDGRGEFVSKYPFKRHLKGRESRSMRIGSFRRQERSADWMDESVRRRQESRVYKGLSFKRREESRAFKTWRLGKREREGDWDEGSHHHPAAAESCSSSSSPGVLGAELGESRSHAAAENAVEVSSLRQAAGLEVPTSSLEPRAGGSECSHSHDMNDTAEERPRLRDDNQRHFRWGGSDSNIEQQQQQQHGLGGLRGGIGPLEARGMRISQREAWREAWRETWGERLGRRARELRREMQSQAAAEMEREGVRRERVREGVRKRQMEIEREALRFDITFWRAEQVVARSYGLTDVSMCIATHAAKPLDVSELERLSCSALAGPLLAATIAHVNEQAGFHNL